MLLGFLGAEAQPDSEPQLESLRQMLPPHEAPGHCHIRSLWPYGKCSEVSCWLVVALLTHAQTCVFMCGRVVNVEALNLHLLRWHSHWILARESGGKPLLWLAWR